MKKILFILLLSVIGWSVAFGLSNTGVMIKATECCSDTLKDSVAKHDTSSKSLKHPTDSIANEDIFSIRHDSVYINRFDTNENDTIQSDSIEKKKSGTTDRPIKYSSRDSMTYIAEEGNINLFGSADVEYGDMTLDADIIAMNLDSSHVYATFSTDSTGEKNGKPVFTQGSESYEMEKITYN
ncbi:MAG: hypothetical protein ACI4TS_00960, partial [Bacteroidaceae bacterium]